MNNAARGGLGVGRLPQTCAPYKSTPSFSADTIPSGLKKAHHTKPGVWGLITVERGRLKYTIECDPEAEYLLEAGVEGVVAPEERHRVAVIDPDTRFHVTFYRTATTN